MPTLEHGRLGGDGDGGAVARDLGGVVDEVLGDVGVVALRNVVLDEDEVGEGVEDGGLLVLRSVGLGGWGAAEGVVVRGFASPAGGEGEERVRRGRARRVVRRVVACIVRDGVVLVWRKRI